MRDVPIGEVIATREFVFHVTDGGERQVTLQIGKPVRPSWSVEETRGVAPPAFVSPFQIVGLSKDERVYAVGIDAVQALVLGFRVLPSWLAITASIYRGRFFFLEEDGLGLPQFSTESMEPSQE